MRTKNDNIETMMGSETCETIEELSNSLLQRYQEGLRGISDSIKLINLSKINLNRGVSYIDSPDYLKSKKGNNKSKK